MNPLYRWTAVLMCGLAGQACLAADLALPAARTQGAISYVTGGIGSDEASAFRAAAPLYNLRITLAAVSGEFLSDVKVSLRDARGNTVAEATSEGPYLFFSVPPGKYQVTADNMGEVLRRTVLARAKGGTELVLRWRTAPES